MLSRLPKLLLSHTSYTSRLLILKAVYAAHTPTCPTTPKKPLVYGSSKKIKGPKRALESGPVRLAFIPEEWFQFFLPKTGVTGPYLLGIMVTNYLVSKEIYVMEHEYYSGLPWIVVLVIVMKKLAPGIAANLDKQVDKTVAEYENSRQDEVDYYNTAIDVRKKSQFTAQAQKHLMAAKKENVAMQLEAEYRERAMRVYRTVKGRLDYHVKKHRTETRIHQRWMVTWIREQVKKSITPDFQRQALSKAIEDLAAAAMTRSNLKL